MVDKFKSDITYRHFYKKEQGKNIFQRDFEMAWIELLSTKKMVRWSYGQA